MPASYELPMSSSIGRLHSIFLSDISAPKVEKDYRIILGGLVYKRGITLLELGFF